MKHFPCRAILRDGMPAIVNGPLPIGQDNDETMLAGQHEKAGYELWLPCGRWSWRACEHPFDIVTWILPGGKCIANANERTAA